MSRRKQSKPRQIKRSLGDLDAGEENALDSHSLSGEEGGVSDPDDSLEGDSSSPPAYTPLYNEEPKTQESRGGTNNEDEDGDERGRRHSGGEEEEEGEDEEEAPWRGPDDLEFSEEGGGSRVVAGRDLHPDTTWGPYPGIIQSQGSTDAEEAEKSKLICEDPDCWINRLPLTSDPSAANCTIYSRGDALFCKVARELVAGEGLLASLSPPPPSSPPLAQPSPPLGLITQNQAAVKEEPMYPAALRSEIQLLPQQAGMAAILATAIINKDIFPCKDCGIWYRSERNLQAHLMYYCASRQKQPAAASSPPQDKPKDSYPNERVCPFPQCNKSCPSASSLEIHMRTHSGERPFVCLICLSAFTTKANCERHLKVHTDTLNGLCHGCGFVSTTRDILYSHLVTSHMVCQPGSRSEVYSPGPGLPKLPLSTGLSPGDSGVVLKCQVCGHNSDSPAQLQQHVRTHLEVRVPTERSPTPRQITPSLVDAPQLSPHEREPVACVPKPDSSSPGANGSSATPRDYSSPDAATTELKIKEEPHSDSEIQEMEITEAGEEEEEEEEAGGEKGKLDEIRKTRDSKGHIASSSSRTSGSPKSPAIATVKAEPTSPTPGSSPAPVGGAESVLPGGAMFLPQYMFNPESAILPQASEILAKMSEMVHSRLKQGQTPQNNPAAFFPAGSTASTAAATPPHKGATCFECDITFNNINNFYAHKRLYCSSRHQAEGDTSASGPGLTRDASSASVPSSGAHGSSASPQGGAASRAASASPADSDSPAGATEPRRAVEVKIETPAGREGISSSSEGEGGATSVGGGGVGGRASEGSQSPASGSAEDQEDDPNRTFCVACNIRFSRHENYTVHKRFYCASRHDPTNHRSVHMAKATTGAAFHPQPIRTRKRKKMYEIHMARTEALANAAAAAAAAAASAAASAPSPSVLGLAVKQEVSPGAAGGSSPEGDGPIDLSKRPRLSDGPRHSSSLLPALPLTDYHKCTACSISFNSIENYLAHKTYYCPATTLQPHTLEQLHRLKRSASTSPKSRPQQERPDLLHPMEAKALPAEWVAQTRGSSSSPRPSALPASEATSPPHPTTTLAAIPGAGAKGAGAGSPQVVCPYCPNRPIAGDLMEHFRTTHSLVATIQPPQEALPQPGSAVSRSPSLSPRDRAAATITATPNSQSRLVSRVHRDGINGQARSATNSPVSPRVNSTPSPGGTSPSAGSPLPMSPPAPPSLSLSPVPDVPRETVGSSHLPDKANLTVISSHISAPQSAQIPGLKTTVISPVQNGNSRFCRLCNIKFSSLSTFIAHKKYYCSSHSAEHVK
ncbi:zinc finger protein ZFPM1 isoform X1 [Platichthys flesus]|uniref:zinc finger protein ZFPM1 isoform X1 n=1 Tax=Platichthys flesus TaxID=8260 RepID=UPI002DBDDD95|nr:zinc finger protein ZFPM1 isoform X1 [Platichthys flesus]